MNFGKYRKIFFTTVFLTVILCGLWSQERSVNVTKRLGLFIGSNNGGRDRVMLRYAVSDAKAVSGIFSEMGGIAPADNIFLVEPTVAEINRRLDAITRDLLSARRNFQRTELVFYFSGHSDEEGLLLNRQRYSYRDLRERINRIDTDMRIVILDSCSSGAITRAKGGVKAPPFLFDSSVSAAGYAFLTSSSADEASQESDSIESSYFTHSLVAGLRGAADTVGDGKVTLNELYRFAYAETLAKTETSIFGAQHPSYDMQISGSGDVILTDIKETSAGLLIDEELTGRITIRDESDFLVAELTKVNQKPMELGLGPGLYRITIQRGDSFYRAEVVLRENNRTLLSMVDFYQIASAPGNRNRGKASEEIPDDTPLYPLGIQLIPGIDLLGRGQEKATNNVLVGILGGIGHNIRGVGAAPLGLLNTGYVHGAQASGIFNITNGYLEGVQLSSVFNITQADVKGIQGAGIFNYADAELIGGQFSGIFNFTRGDVTGVQAASIFNFSPGSILGAQIGGIFNWAGEMKGFQAGLVNYNEIGRGVQIGLVNISGSEDMLPIGLVNIVKGGMIHPFIYMDDMFLNAGLRSGTKHFYSHFSAGMGGSLIPGRDGDRLMVTRGGFGFEYPINKFFVDIDASIGSINNFSAKDRLVDGNEISDWKDFSNTTTAIYQIRLSVGYKILEHLGVFAGISYDWLQRFDNNAPNPEDFGFFIIGRSSGKNTHKLGVFAGVQF
jgi:hypothetical protein